MLKWKRSANRTKKEQEDTGLKEGTIGTEEYAIRFSQQIEKINSANGSALAEYIAHRKVILDLLEYNLYRTDGGAYQTESILHDLVYYKASGNRNKALKDNQHT